MQIKVSSLFGEERTKPAHGFRLALSASLSFKTPSGGVHVQALHVLREVERVPSLKASEYRHLGITVFCTGVKPEEACLWCSPELASPIDIPSSFIAQITSPDLQPLLDMTADLASHASLSAALESAGVLSRRWQKRETRIHRLCEERRPLWRRQLRHAPLAEAIVLEKRIQRRVSRYFELESELHRRAERCTKQYFFLSKIMSRRAMPEGDRKDELRRRVEYFRSFKRP